MAILNTLPNVQAVRRVLENDTLTDEATPASSRIFHLPYHSDTSSGKDILLWDDILAAFKEDVVHVRSGTIILPLLKGPDFKNLDPLRIAAVPGVTLDVVVRVPLGTAKELSLESLQRTLPNTRQGGSHASSTLVSDTTTRAATTVRRNPVGGLVEEAMQNYNHIDNPAMLSPRRGPQATSDDQAAAPKNNDIDILKSPTIITSSNSDNSDLRPGAPQELSSTPSSVFAETMMKARLGDKEAQFAVGRSYFDGQGVQQDYQTAADWFLKAAEQGYAPARNFAGHLYQHGLGMTQDYSKAMEWYQKAAEQGNADVYYNIGYLYRYGLGVAQDYSKAMEWFQKSAEQGNAAAQSNIGWLHHQGLGVPKDYSQAMEWYRKSAEQGHAPAQSNIGYLYLEGLGVPKDYSQAMKWYRKSAEQGHAPAQSHIGYLYLEGLGVPKDYSQAMEWYQKAADRGSVIAPYNIGWLYEHGQGVQKDEAKAKAMEWYKKAADGGLVEAKERLDELERQGYDSVGGGAGKKKRGLLNRIFN